MLLELGLTGAALIGLLRTYKDEVKDQQDLTHQRFLEWLLKNNHVEIKSLIENQSSILETIDTLLRQDTKAILEKVDQIQKMLDGLCTTTFNPQPHILDISDQSFLILDQLVKSGCDKMVYLDLGENFCLQTTNNIPIGITDPQFLKDDLGELMDIGLLRFEYGSDGRTMIFTVTRNAAKLVKEKSKSI